MARGGKRKGAGRPEGKPNRPNILDFWDGKDIADFFAHLKRRYKKSDRLATWVGDQISHKAPQAIDLTSGGKPLLIAPDDE